MLGMKYFMTIWWECMSSKARLKSFRTSKKYVKPRNADHVRKKIKFPDKWEPFFLFFLKEKIVTWPSILVNVKRSLSSTDCQFKSTNFSNFPVHKYKIINFLFRLKV